MERLKQSSELREQRGVEFLKETEEYELNQLREDCEERQLEIEEGVHQIEEMIAKLVQESRKQRKLNFADFVAVMSGTESSIQRQLNKQVLMGVT